jgi:copper chaperone NosL
VGPRHLRALQHGDLRPRASPPRCAAARRTSSFKFDDIGCLVFWLRDKAAQHPWMAESGHALWVADAAGKGRHLAGPAQGALQRRRDLADGLQLRRRRRDAEAGSLGFCEEMRQHVLAKGK